MIAPFLKEKFGWVNSDTCWWCVKGKQTREHLFKECSAWKQEIRKLWKEVEEATGDQEGRLKGGIYKGKKGFRLGVQGQDRRGGRSPGNTSIRSLMADERCIPAVISFLESTKCGKVKEGIIVRERNSSG